MCLVDGNIKKMVYIFNLCFHSSTAGQGVAAILGWLLFFRHL